MRVLFPIVALFAAACAPIRPSHVSEAVFGGRAQVEVVNVASKGQIEVSDGAWNKLYAVDGDADTWWSADNAAPQWLEITLDFAHQVERVEVVVSQVRPGPASHEVTLSDGSGKTVIASEFNTSSTADKDTFVLDLNPARFVASVRILAKQTEGWVAFREVRVMAQVPLFGEPAEPWIQGFSQPVLLTHAGDGSGRLFVLEKEGRIRIVRNGALMSSPFLDISPDVSATNHQGLLGLAFPPDYAEQGLFYVTYTSNDQRNVISRFAVSPDPNRADHGSEEVVLSFPLLSDSHTAGMLAFGPNDGLLYVATGDGEVDGEAAQATNSLYGKILRIDVGPAAQPYTVPPNNPFVGVPGYAPEIWALGLRNPWGMAFDRQSGDLFITDTGLSTQEEVNVQPAEVGGANFGWPRWEGDLCLRSCELGNLTMPIVTYPTRGGGNTCAIVGGAVYKGWFVYGDFCAGKIWMVGRDRQSGWASRSVANLGVPISSIGVDEAGNMFAVGFAPGGIYRLFEE